MYSVKINKSERFGMKELISSTVQKFESEVELKEFLDSNLFTGSKYSIRCKSYSRKKLSCSLVLTRSSVRYEVRIRVSKGSQLPTYIKDYVFLGLESDSELLKLDLVAMLMNRINHDFSNIEFYKHGGSNSHYLIEFKLFDSPVPFKWDTLKSRS